MLRRIVLGVALGSIAAFGGAASARTLFFVGEAHRTIPLASAAYRDDDHVPKMDVTVWYPAAAGAHETALTIGPAG